MDKPLTLYIGNKNYSSWSMRPWVLMTQMGIAFDEHVVRFDNFSPESSFKKTMAKLCPTGKVPVLADGDLIIWDSLAIVEYLAERFSSMHLWPQDTHARSLARSICAEMHSGFAALRTAYPMNIEASLPQIGELMLRDRAAVRNDLTRIDQMWSSLLSRYGGPMLFGPYSIADAFFAPVVMRIKTYELPVSQAAGSYVQACLETRGVEAWVRGAMDEHDFRDFEEPYRLKPNSSA